ncbi:hypothetical protein EKI60_01315 [Candidatus Saccharibacteria bacterium]|nr:MAG: hypothetical protein EKI60_01315 [Candidatus Saccharibacteria bacterium]
MPVHESFPSQPPTNPGHYFPHEDEAARNQIDAEAEEASRRNTGRTIAALIGAGAGLVGGGLIASLCFSGGDIGETQVLTYDCPVVSSEGPGLVNGRMQTETIVEADGKVQIRLRLGEITDLEGTGSELFDTQGVPAATLEILCDNALGKDESEEPGEKSGMSPVPSPDSVEGGRGNRPSKTDGTGEGDESEKPGGEVPSEQPEPAPGDGGDGKDGLDGAGGFSDGAGSNNDDPATDVVFILP